MALAKEITDSSLIWDDISWQENDDNTKGQRSMNHVMQ